MLLPDGTEFWVEDGQGNRYPEHGMEAETDQRMNRTYSTYLEINLGDNFCIRCEAPAQSFANSINYYADNTFIAGWSHKQGVARSDIVKGKKVTASTFRLLQFSTIETTDDFSSSNRDQEYLKNLGEIRCDQAQGRLITAEAFEDSEEVAGHLQTNKSDQKRRIDESLKLHTSIGSRVTFGQSFISHQSERFNLDPLGFLAGASRDFLSKPKETLIFQGADHLPSYRVVFKYRTRSALILAKIIKDPFLAEEEEASTFKRKESSKGRWKFVLDDDDDEDEGGRAFQKKPRAGPSKEAAIDLT